MNPRQAEPARISMSRFEFKQPSCGQTRARRNGEHVYFLSLSGSLLIRSARRTTAFDAHHRSKENPLVDRLKRQCLGSSEINERIKSGTTLSETLGRSAGAMQKNDEHSVMIWKVTVRSNSAITKRASIGSESIFYAASLRVPARLPKPCPPVLTMCFK